MSIYDVLKKLNISYNKIEHEAVFTAHEAQVLKKRIKGVGCKNLFLKSEPNNYYLYMLEDNKQANLKKLEEFLNIKKIHFASSNELMQILDLPRGGVTPLGIINDLDNKVTIILDANLVNKVLLMHPEVNTKTLAINYKDLIKYIEYLDHSYLIFSWQT